VSVGSVCPCNEPPSYFFTKSQKPYCRSCGHRVPTIFDKPCH